MKKYFIAAFVAVTCIAASFCGCAGNRNDALQGIVFTKVYRDGQDGFFYRAEGELTAREEGDCYYIHGEYNGAVVEEVGDICFDGTSNTLWLGEGIERIADMAMQDEMGVSYMYLPASLQQIGERAFYNARTYNVTFFGTPDIGKYAFCGSSINKLYIPMDIKSGHGLADNAFCHSGLYTAILYCNYIGRQCFAYCNTLKYVDVGNVVDILGEEAFIGCKNLSYADIGTNIPANAFKDCTSLLGVEVGPLVEYVYASAFSGCTSLSAVRFVVSEDWYVCKDEYSRPIAVADFSTPENAVRQFAEAAEQGYVFCRLPGYGMGETV